MVARLGEHGDEWVEQLVNSSPSSSNRRRFGRSTDGGSHPRWRSWSDTTSRTFGRSPFTSPPRPRKLPGRRRPAGGELSGMSRFVRLVLVVAVVVGGTAVAPSASGAAGD